MKCEMCGSTNNVSKIGKEGLMIINLCLQCVTESKERIAKAKARRGGNQ